MGHLSPHFDRFVSTFEQSQQEFVQALRMEILMSTPEIEERFTYDIPFYYYQGRLFFINQIGGKVTLGFCNGVLLEDENDLLEGNQKEIRHYYVESMDDINRPELQEVLQEAIAVRAKENRE